MLIEIPNEKDFEFVLNYFDSVLDYFDTISKISVHRYCIIINHLIKNLEIDDETQKRYKRKYLDIANSVYQK